ncbi:response regulator transcription factor [Vallitalea okinawensis]|uniref:response regulator transcription factor n=1 Tax=Vallitalea okinawensis TaxID=2078660 RepID=UPI00130089E1|nr:response regulator [Vallitalea okinawensis]
MKRYNLLLVDDAEIELDGLVFLIKKYQYPFNIFRANNGVDALNILDEETFDLIITDIRMPEMDGLELVSKIRERKSNATIIISSAYRDFTYAKQAMKLNIEDYLVKPINIEEFRHVMSKVLQEINGYQDQYHQEVCAYIFQAVYGKNSSSLYQALKSIGYSDDSEYSLIVMYNSEHFFDMRVEKMALIMNQCLSSEYFYVNLNEQESLILIPKNNSQKKINEECHKLFDKISREGHFIFSVSSRFFNIEELNHQFQFLGDLLENQLYKGCNQYLINNEYIEPYMEGSSEIKKRIDVLCENIQLKNLKIVKEQIDDFFSYLKSDNNYSAFFVKYLICNVINSFINNYQISQNASVIINRIMKHYQLQELHQEVLLIFEEAAKAQQLILSEKKEAVKEAVQFINENYNRDISLQTLADHVYLSPNYLSYLFKLEMEQTITEYLINRRLEKAKYLLQHTPLKITQVSRQVGYENVPYFTSLFKKYYGMTPGCARKEWRKT